MQLSLTPTAYVCRLFDEVVYNTYSFSIAIIWKRRIFVRLGPPSTYIRTKTRPKKMMSEVEISESGNYGLNENEVSRKPMT